MRRPTATVTLNAVTQPPTTHTRRRWPIYAAVALIAAGAVLYWTVIRDTTFTVTGTITVVDSDSNGLTFGPGSGQCVGRAGYNDLTDTTQVVITDAAGTIVATGRVDGYGTDASQGSRGQSVTRCVFAFTVDGVPAGGDFYGVEVARRGKLTYPVGDLRKPLPLEIGR